MDRNLTPIELTSAQHKVVRQFLFDNDEYFLELNGNVYRKNAIRDLEIKEIKPSKHKNKGYWCNFGTKHRLDEDCECQLLYGGSWADLWGYLRQKDYGVVYPKDITDDMKQEYIAHCIK